MRRPKDKRDNTRYVLIATERQMDAAITALHATSELLWKTEDGHDEAAYYRAVEKSFRKQKVKVRSLAPRLSQFVKVVAGYLKFCKRQQLAAEQRGDTEKVIEWRGQVLATEKILKGIRAQMKK